MSQYVLKMCGVPHIIDHTPADKRERIYFNEVSIMTDKEGGREGEEYSVQESSINSTGEGAILVSQDFSTNLQYLNTAVV